MRKYIYILIVIIGLLQAIGFLLGNKMIRGMGTVSGSSPLPLVFTEIKGVETFASDFYIQYVTAEGKKEEIQITPAMYSKLKGPYNRRNIYGAAISYGPILRKEIWGSVFDYGFCKKTIIKEMGLPPDGTDYAIKIRTKTAGRDDVWTLTPVCTNVIKLRVM